MKQECNIEVPALTAGQRKRRILHRSSWYHESLMRLHPYAALLLLTVWLHAAEIKGKVTNAAGGEALERVQVVVLETKSAATTSIGGEFNISNLPPGNYTLRLNAVGYRMPRTIPEERVAELGPNASLSALRLSAFRAALVLIFLWRFFFGLSGRALRASW